MDYLPVSRPDLGSQHAGRTVLVRARWDVTDEQVTEALMAQRAADLPGRPIVAAAQERPGHSPR